MNYESSLLFMAVLYPLVTLLMRQGTRKQALWQSLALVVVGLAIKLGTEMKGAPSNFYTIMEVGRQSSPTEIRKSYKSISKRLHPDKNPSKDAEEQFQIVKNAYDILMDESKRDIYNRFGPTSLSFDPRQDELKLLSGVGVAYLFWIVTAYISTMPIAARASRTWVAIVGIVILVIEVALCLTESTIPSWMPKYMTEAELVLLLHTIFPAFIVGLRCLAESLYVDIDQATKDLLEKVLERGSELEEMQKKLQEVLGASGLNKKSDVSEDLQKMRSKLTLDNEAMAKSVETLKNTPSDPAAPYYWMLLVAMYAAMFFTQNASGSEGEE